MNNTSNIPATLNLAQSLQTFEQTIVTALAIDDVGNWDGRTLRDREQEIRQSALILAGECIALLLHNLSQLKEAHTVAQLQTKGWRHPKSQGHGRIKRQVLTIANVVVPLWLPYVVERQNKASGKRRNKRGQGFCPFLRWLCMEEGITPLVWSKVAEAGTVSASFAIASSSLKAWGISMSLKRIERLTYHFNQQGLSVRHSQLFHLKQGTLPTTPVLKDQRVLISVDGGRIRIRYPKKGKPYQQSKRHGYKGEWTEPKLVTIYVVNEQGKRVNTAHIPVTNDGTYGKLQPFLRLLEMHLARLGINLASLVLLVADGAGWIWNHIPPLLLRLGCPPSSTHELLDFYHATEHLQLFADAAFTQLPQRQAPFKIARCTLKCGHAANLLEQMQALSKKMRGERRSIMLSQIQYFSRFYQQGRLEYSQVAAKKMPIGPVRLKV